MRCMDLFITGVLTLYCEALILYYWVLTLYCEVLILYYWVLTLCCAEELRDRRRSRSPRVPRWRRDQPTAVTQ